MTGPTTTTAVSTTLTQLPPGHYIIVPDASQVTFVTKHMFGTGSVRGRFGDVEGFLDVQAPVQVSRGHVTIDTTGFDSAHAKRDKVVRSARFLHVDQHPAITVDLDGVEIGDGVGATAEVVVRVQGEPTNVRAHLTDLRLADGTVHARITARVDRLAHGVRSGRGMVGRHLDITLALVARRDSEGAGR